MKRHQKILCPSRLALFVLLSALMFSETTWAKPFAPSNGMASLSSTSKQLPSNNKTESYASLSSLIIGTRAGGDNDWKSFSLSSGFINRPMWESLRSITFLNIIGYLVSCETRSQLHTDLLGVGAFVAAALPSYLRSPAIMRVKLSSAAVIIWGVKLSYFLLFRQLKQGHDFRLVDMLSTRGGCATFWFMSWVWGVVCSLPYTLGTTSPILGDSTSLTIGLIMYVSGLLVETLADYQKWVFKGANPGKICNVGLWSYSQHPNFFGNLLLWAGIFVMNAPALIEPVPPGSSQWEKIKGYRRLVLACFSQWFMWNLFYGQATGALSDSVNLAATKYKKDPNYKKYVQTVPLIIPIRPFDK